MAIKPFYPTQEEIPEQYRDLYSERGGRFDLTGVEGVKTQADIDKLNESLRKERADHKATKDKLTAFGELDPTDIHAQLEAGKEAQARIETLTKEGQLDE